MLKVLFLCTGNSARSQIAEALLNSKGGDRIIAYSAGSEPAKDINPFAVKVLKELGIDISTQKPKNLELFADKYFDYVITLCDRAKNQCPTIISPSVHLHWGFADPKYFEGSDEEKLRQFKTLVNEISTRIQLFLGLPLEKSDANLLKKMLSEIVELN
jgi:arsenate reductase